MTRRVALMRVAVAYAVLLPVCPAARSADGEGAR